MINALIAALYVAMTVMVSPIAQGPIQLRISEGLNHLVVFNKKLMWGILSGVLLFNLLFSTAGLLDVLFGGLQTFIALTLTIISSRWIKDYKKRMIINTCFFSFSMILIAMMISIVSNQTIGSAFFWSIYGSLFISEFIIMTVMMPVMYYINQRIQFETL